MYLFYFLFKSLVEIVTVPSKTKPKRWSLQKEVKALQGAITPVHLLAEKRLLQYVFHHQLTSIFATSLSCKKKKAEEDRK